MIDYLKTFVLWLIAVAMVFAVPYLILTCVDATQANREAVAIARYEKQLDKCRGGNFCKIEAQDRTFQFLTISAREAGK